MISKLSLSLTAALALSAAAPRVARADAVATSTDEARALAGNPHSVDYRNRPTGSRSPTKDELVSAAIGAMFDGALERWTRATHDRPPEAGLAAYIESYLSAETPRHQGRRVSDGRARLGSAALGCPVADRVCGRRAGAHRYHRSAARAARPREAGDDGGLGDRGAVREPLPRPVRA